MRFEIKSYLVSTNMSRLDPGAFAYMIRLFSIYSTSPGQLRITALFMPGPVADPGALFGTLDLVVRMPASEFPIWYDILRNERPVYVDYTLGAGNKVNGFALTTSTEPIGEGSDDASAVYL